MRPTTRRLFQHQRTDKAPDGWLGGEITDDIGATLDLFVQAFKRVGRVDLPPVSLWEFAPDRAAANRLGDGLRQERAEPLVGQDIAFTKSSTERVETP